MKLTINVTQENIDKSRPFTKYHCPIALAVVEAFKTEEIGNPAYSFASIDSAEGRFHESGQRATHRFEIPEKARQFIRDRDERIPVAPFSFEIKAEAYTPKSQYA